MNKGLNMHIIRVHLLPEKMKNACVWKQTTHCSDLISLEGTLPTWTHVSKTDWYFILNANGNVGVSQQENNTFIACWVHLCMNCVVMRGQTAYQVVFMSLCHQQSDRQGSVQH